jgi:hypothetical protein
MNKEPLRRDVNTTTGNAFGNITDVPNLANLMSDPLGTDVVGGLTITSTINESPSNVEETVGQPPQVQFRADAGEVVEDDAETTVEGLMKRVKALPSWAWLVGAGAVGAGIYARRRM